jgi:hypothetical protein
MCVPLYCTHFSFSPYTLYIGLRSADIRALVTSVGYLKLEILLRVVITTVTEFSGRNWFKFRPVKLFGTASFMWLFSVPSDEFPTNSVHLFRSRCSRRNTRLRRFYITSLFVAVFPASGGINERVRMKKRRNERRNLYVGSKGRKAFNEVRK